ncbi:MAG: O-antigen ligase family protein [Firmicutes bacterium]|nr:O-antigen ligase family protein [Bacillota bacterium]
MNGSGPPSPGVAESTPWPARLLRAWDASWVGRLAAALWDPGGRAPGAEVARRPGSGLGLAALVAVSVLDAWALGASFPPPFAEVVWAANLGLIALGGEFGLYLVLAAVPFVSDPVALSMVAVLVGSDAVRGRLGGSLTLRDLSPARDPALALLAGLLVAATLTSQAGSASLRHLGVWLLGVGLYWSLARRGRNPEVLRRAALAFALSAFLAGVHGLYQAWARVPVQRAWVDVRAFPQGGTRVYSIWGNPNVFALHLILTTPFLVTSVWSAPGRRGRLALAFGAVVAALALVLTLSRAGWAGLGLALLFIAVARDRRVLLASALAALLAVVVAPDTVLARVATLARLDDPTAVHRLRIWEASARMAADFWYAGLGLGWRAFAALYPQYAIQGRAAFHAHSHYLESLLELGILGFLALHWVLLRPLVWFWRGAKAARANGDRSPARGVADAVLLGVAAALLGILVFGVAEPVFYLPRPTLLAWAVLGLAAAARAAGAAGPGPGGVRRTVAAGA